MPNNTELQYRLDIEKWLDSEINNRDMCGSYKFCKFCNSSDATPCANAFETMNAKSKSKPLEEISTVLGKKFNYNKVMEKKANRKSLTFAEKFILSDQILKDRYSALQKALTSNSKGKSKIKSRISKQCDTYRRDGDIVAKITIIGSSLRLNLPLDTKDKRFCDGKTPHLDTGHKKVYEGVPFQFKVNSKLALKRAIALIELIK